MDETTFSRTLDAIYDAAVAPEHWPVALDRLGRAFGCHSVTLIDRNLKTMQGCSIGIGVGADAASNREYFEVWRDRNVFNTRTQVWQAGAIVTDREILPKSDLLRSAYYSGFMKPRDMHALLRLSLRVEDGVHQSISLLRPRSAQDYEKSDVELGRSFLPHLQRAATTTRHLRHSKTMFAAATELLEASATGIMLLDSSGRIGFANRAARVMADRSDGFLLRLDRMEALRPQDDAGLRRLIARATGRIDRVDAPRSGVMRLRRKPDLRDYVVVVAPLTPGSTPFEGPAPVAFILITDPDATPMRPRSILRQAYDLTATETRMAERLLMGDTPEQAAAALEIKISTARGHLAALFRKTETSRQTELIRLLLSLPWSDGEAGR
ncbi:MAG: helix-turn-helix transcriptional regulator [Hyphomicrobiales bacterium]